MKKIILVLITLLGIVSSLPAVDMYQMETSNGPATTLAFDDKDDLLDNMMFSIALVTSLDPMSINEVLAKSITAAWEELPTKYRDDGYEYAIAVYDKVSYYKFEFFFYGEAATYKMVVLQNVRK